jgi:hypothetical protein
MREKKVVFIDDDDQYARMLVRLRYDKLTQGNFFRGLVELYVENDLDMAKVIEKVKTVKTPMGVKKRKQTIKDIELGEEMKRDFGLSDNEKNFIYDLIEEDFDE